MSDEIFGGGNVVQVLFEACICGSHSLFGKNVKKKIKISLTTLSVARNLTLSDDDNWPDISPCWVQYHGA